METKHLEQLLGRALEEQEELQDKIEKAIEYIQDRYDGEVITHTFDKDNIKELLRILKGE